MDVRKLEKLAAMAAETGSINFNGYHFVNLETVKQITGKAWPGLHKKIFDSCEVFLEKRLTDDDLIIKLNDGFLVVFAHINNQEAAQKGKQLGEEIVCFFIGEQAFKDIQLNSRISQINIEDLDEKIENIKKDSHILPLIEVGQIQDESLNWETEISDVIQLTYRPVWDNKNEIITSNTCIPYLAINGLLRHGRDIVAEDESLELLRNLDMFMLKQSQRISGDIARKNNPCVITVTVSYRTLNDRAARIAYYNQLSKTPKRLRKFFLICVDEIPSGAPQTALIEIFRPLKNLCGATLVHSLPIEIQFSSFFACGISLFGFSLQDYLQQEQELSSHQLEKISYFCEQAQKLNAMVYLTQVVDMDHLPVLKSAGVRYLSGPCIGKESPLPIPPSTLQATNVFCPNCLNKDTCSPEPGHPVPCSEFEKMMAYK